jgi:uncharacterized protein
MKIQIETLSGLNVIRAYAPGELTVNEEVYRGSLIVTPQRLESWAPQTFEELASAHFEPLVALGPEVVLIGTGRRLCFPPPDCLAPLIEAGIGYEIMDTGAACRTYNILVADGRRVVAALLMIEAE